MLCLAVACSREGCNDAKEKTITTGAAAVELGIHRTILSSTDAEGLSGLAVDDHGDFIAVSERDRFLVRFHEDGQEFRAEPRRIPLVGVRQGLDTESIAFMSPGHFAIGTEMHQGRKEDAILLVEMVGDEAHVTDELQLDYGAWGERAGINSGIEALCYADGSLILGSEVVITEHGKRYAPLARYNLQTKAWSYGKLWLTSDAGKLSSLECRPAKPGVIDIIGIERHFGVGRVIRFDAPAEGELQGIQARVALDLIPLIQPLPNYEGSAWDAHGNLVLMTDNSYVIVDKPTEVTMVPATALAP